MTKEVKFDVYIFSMFGLKDFSWLNAKQALQKWLSGGQLCGTGCTHPHVIWQQPPADTKGKLYTYNRSLDSWLIWVSINHSMLQFLSMWAEIGYDVSLFLDNDCVTLQFMKCAVTCHGHKDIKVCIWACLFALLWDVAGWSSVRGLLVS